MLRKSGHHKVTNLARKEKRPDCVALCRLTKWSALRKYSLSHISSAAAAQQSWSCITACSRCSCGGLRRVWVSCRLPLATCSSPDGALAQGAPALPQQPCLPVRLARAAVDQCSTSTDAPSGRAQQLDPVISQYRDRRFDGSQEQFEECLKSSTTLYVGNLSFYTTEEQIYEVRPGQQQYLTECCSGARALLCADSQGTDL